MPEETCETPALPSREEMLETLAQGKIVHYDGRTASDESQVDFILSCYAQPEPVQEVEPKPEPSVEAPAPVEESAPVVQEESPVATEETPAAEPPKAKGK